jgi:ATP-dependent Clp protease ATP-binding subunit ClpC
MFERYTQRARQVVVFAQDEARALQHDHIGTEHLLLGLLRETKGLAARVLAELDITLMPVRTRVLDRVAAGEGNAGQIPLSAHARQVLDLALREATAGGHHLIGTEHILLALVRENEGLAARVLLDCGAGPQRIRDEVKRLLPRPAPQRPGTDVASAAARDRLPDIGRLSDEGLDDLIDELIEAEQEVSYRRRILHGKIDLLRAERDFRREQRRQFGS